MAGWKVEVTGLRELMNALEAVDKKAATVVKKRITDAGKSVAAQASYLTPGRNPVSNWGTFFDRGRDVSYDPSAAAGGFKVRRSNFRRRGVSAGIAWDVVQTNAGASMYEVIGDGSRVTTASGQNLVDSINARFPGKSPRSLIPAYYAVMTDGLQDEIADQILTEARKAGLV